MIEEIHALRDESRTLHALLAGLPDRDWLQPTPFKRWTVWDVVAHLHLSDRWALAAIESREGFAAAAQQVLSALKSGTALTAYTRAYFGPLAGAELLGSWRTTHQRLHQLLAGLDVSTRLAWFGPDMGLRSFVTARYMETWAHGQDVYDLLGAPRSYSDAIRAIADLGVRTFGFTFANRGLTVPESRPHVRLRAPSGAVWEWNPPSSSGAVEGLASEFCHVVTQNRNIADTGLVVTGEVARQWMAIAQCFAGRPEDPPAPGTRTGATSRRGRD